jgi:hypothetical protein
MEVSKIRKEITQLIDNIKEHSDYISDFERIPQVELDIIIAKIRKLHERTIIFNHEYEQEMLTRRVRKEIDAQPVQKQEAVEMPKSTVVQPAPELQEQNQLKQEYQAFMPQQEQPLAEVSLQSNYNAVSNINAPQAPQEPIVKEDDNLLQEDNVEQKTIATEPEKTQLTEDKPEEKLVKEEPGTHIYEKPVRKEEEPIRKETEEQEKAKKAELHERLRSFAETGSVNERIGESKIHSSLSNRLQMNPISDLTRAIGLNEKFLFIKVLFNNDSEAFTEALKLLNNFENFAAASHFLFDNLANKYNWDKNAESVAKFIELVQRRYL